LTLFRRADNEPPLVSTNQGVTTMFEAAVEPDLRALRSLIQRYRGGGAQDPVAEVARRRARHRERVSRALSQRSHAAPSPGSEGVRFSTLLDDVRLEMAQRYLAAGIATLTEVAFCSAFRSPTFLPLLQALDRQGPGGFQAGPLRQSG
jgi:AraC-like DNA-binding protein